MGGLTGRFTLTIDLGNDAMQSDEQIAAALRRVAARLNVGGEDHGNIIDDNGNKVGTFAIEED